MHISSLNMKEESGVLRFCNIDCTSEQFQTKISGRWAVEIFIKRCYYKSWSKLSYYKKEIF